MVFTGTTHANHNTISKYEQTQPFDLFYNVLSNRLVSYSGEFPYLFSFVANTLTRLLLGMVGATYASTVYIVCNTTNTFHVPDTPTLLLTGTAALKHGVGQASW